MKAGNFCHEMKFQIILSCHLIQIYDPLILLLLRRRITWSPPKSIYGGKKFIFEINLLQAKENNLIPADSFYMYFDAFHWLKILTMHKNNDINHFKFFSMSNDLLGKTLNDID